MTERCDFFVMDDACSPGQELASAMEWLRRNTLTLPPMVRNGAYLSRAGGMVRWRASEDGSVVMLSTEMSEDAMICSGWPNCPVCMSEAERCKLVAASRDAVSYQCGRIEGHAGSCVEPDATSEVDTVLRILNAHGICRSM